VTGTGDNGKSGGCGPVRVTGTGDNGKAVGCCPVRVTGAGGSEKTGSCIPVRMTGTGGRLVLMVGGELTGSHKERIGAMGMAGVAAGWTVGALVVE
jgi:hypothetical protein